MKKFLSDDIEKEIAKMLYCYNKDEKLIDYDFIYKCIMIIIEYKGIESFVKNLEFSNINAPASYSFKKKKITINDEFMNSLFKKYKNDLLFVNASILNYIIHEIVHAEQHKNVIYKDDLDAKLMRASFDFNSSHLSVEDKRHMYIDDYLHVAYAKHYRSLYDEYYYTFPSERLAYFHSIMEKNEILRYIKNQETEKIIQYDMKYLFLKLNDDFRLSKSKNKLISPLGKFIEIHDLISYFKPIKEDCFSKEVYKSLSLLERFIYGYPISIKENLKIMNSFTKKLR